MESSPPQPPAAQPTSLLARLLNVFAIPSQVFAEVNASQTRKANWLVPVLLASLVGMLTAFILFSQPAVVEQVTAQQAKLFGEYVKSGLINQAQADEALKTYSSPAVLKTGRSLIAAAGSLLGVLWWGFVLWLLGRLFLKTKFPYHKAVEVAGLASMISLLGSIVTLLLTVNFSNPAATHLVTALSDAKSEAHAFPLAVALNLFGFWFIGVTAAGLARLAGVGSFRTFPLVAAGWLLQQMTLLSLGAAAGGMISGAK